MTDDRKNQKTAVVTPTEDASGSTLLPMLIGGLVLITIVIFGALLFV